MLVQFCIAAVAAVLLIGWTAVIAEIERNADRICSLSQRWPYLACHFLALGVLVPITSGVMQAPGAPAARAAIDLLWLTAAATSVACLGLSILDTRTWIQLLRRQGLLLILGCVIAAIASGAGSLAELCWRPLGQGTIHIASGLLGLIYSNVVYSLSDLSIGTSSFGVRIAPECSGYEGIGLVVTFLGVYLSLFQCRFRFPHALMLLPLGAIVIWLLNAGRIAALIAVGTSWSKNVALGGFHSQVGWLVFNGVALGMVALTARIGFLKRDQLAEGLRLQTSRAPAYLAPWLALLAVGMLTGTISTGVDWLYPLRLAAAGLILWHYRAVYASFDWSWSWQAAVIGILTAVVWIGLVATGDVNTSPFRGFQESSSTVWIAIWSLSRVIGYVAVVPLVEELAFRGYLTRRLISSDFESLPMGQFSWISLIGSSLLFGALHGQHWIAGSIAGFLFAVALYRRRRLGDAILAHATTNVSLALYAISTKDWSVWS